ncbi:MAG TPA: hypothetical protein VD997_15125 [Phycisphaerales bacterium]|nr:hypothetical protein [Phycisphaerales bacterium]
MPARPALLAAVLLTAPVHAQWTAEILGPADGSRSIANGVHANQQAGSLESPANAPRRAVLWSGDPGFMIDLHPAGSTTSEAFAAHAGQQGGSADGRACYWTGSAASFTLLSNDSSDVWAVFNGQQGGDRVVGGSVRASLWSGTPESWIDLSLPGFGASAVFGMSQGQQVGLYLLNAHWNFRACMWSGSGASFVDLHPSGFSSSTAYGCGDGQQVGTADSRAALWTGSAASFTDLTPPGVGLIGAALAVCGGIQVGSIAPSPASYPRAALWRGSAATFEDLSTALPPTAISSHATGVWTDGQSILVSGQMRIGDEHFAVLWRQARCGTSDFNNDGDIGTDQDIEAFFACLGGHCCPTCYPGADFNADGDTGTDADIESFFRALGGQPC